MSLAFEGKVPASMFEVIIVAESLSHEVAVEEEKENQTFVVMDPGINGGIVQDIDVDCELGSFLTLNVVAGTLLVVIHVSLMLIVRIRVGVFVSVSVGFLEANRNADSGEGINDGHLERKPGSISSIRDVEGMLFEAVSIN